MTRKELKEILRQDFTSNNYCRFKQEKNARIKRILCSLHLLAYSDTAIVRKYIYALRHIEYHLSNKGIYHKFMSFIWYNRQRQLTRKTGFQIPPFTCGPGLKIIHIGEVVINKNASIGKNFSIIPPVLIGTRSGTGISPKIGNNVFISFGSCIIGDITIGDNVVIAQNVVVNKDIPTDSVLVSNQPRIIR